MKKILVFLISMFLFLPSAKCLENTLAPNAKSAILIESSTGEILYEHNAHEKLAPASMTKMMSLLIIMESIEAGVINYDDLITVSENASSMGGSQILLETGEQMTVDDLLKGITVSSGNDAVVALAEAIAGTEENFVNMMNKRAHELGLKNTNFKNCHGLDEENHYSSAYDMAIIAKELVEHQKILDFSSIYETYLRQGTDRQIWLVNTNKLVRFKPGVDGLKTGYTDNSGYCLTATMKKDDMRVIAVAMGEPDSSTRNNEVSSMLDYAFAQYGLKSVLKTNVKVKDVKLNKSKQAIVSVVPTKDVSVVYKKINKVPNPTYKIKLNKLPSEIKKGEIIGKISVYSDDKLISEVNLTVSENVYRLNIFELFLKYLKEIITGN